MIAQKEKTKQRISSEDIIVHNIVAYVWGFIGIAFISVFSDLQALIVSRWLLVLVPYLCVICYCTGWDFLWLNRRHCCEAVDDVYTPPASRSLDCTSHNDYTIQYC
ncbi:MAG: hypothetical protein AAFQ07_01730, partial [Chloroflexota bacterium]